MASYKVKLAQANSNLNRLIDQLVDVKAKSNYERTLNMTLHGSVTKLITEILRYAVLNKISIPKITIPDSNKVTMKVETEMAIATIEIASEIMGALFSALDTRNLNNPEYDDQLVTTLENQLKNLENEILAIIKMQDDQNKGIRQISNGVEKVVPSDSLVRQPSIATDIIPIRNQHPEPMGRHALRLPDGAVISRHRKMSVGGSRDASVNTNRETMFSTP